MTNHLADTAFDKNLYAPLFTFSVARFSIEFKAREKWRVYGTENAFRGRLGFNLKRACCPFPGFRNRSCDDCELSANCLYITLFSPVATTLLGNRNPSFTPVRPFVPALDGETGARILEPGQAGKARLTLFGPAIRYCSLFLEAAVSALSAFPLEIGDISIEKPPFLPDKPQKQSLAWPLSVWISQPPDMPVPDEPRLRFVTPVRLSENGHRLHDQVTFLNLIQAIVRRLRDLKRSFGEDDHMGKADRQFYRTAEAVSTADNRLYWSMRKRYSVRQGQDVFLNGFRGDIRLKGPVLPFLPLLRAGEIVHIGKGTSVGNGRICLFN